MTGGRDPLSREVSKEAHDWFAKMRGPTSDAVRADFEAWRAADPAHAEAYERQLQHWDRLAFLANTGLGRGRNLASVAKHRHSRKQMAAACAGIVVFGAVSVYLLQVPSSLSAQTLHLHVETKAKRRVVALDDDTRVTIESQSVLDLSFTPRQRHARLSRGSASFQTTRADPRPLVVEAAGNRIVAGVAVFSVALEGANARVVSTTGGVSIDNPPATAKPQVLAPGGRVLLPAQSGSDGPRASEVAGREAMLAFDDVPLDAAIARFNASGGKRLVLATPSLAKRRVTGAFRTSDPGGFARAAVAMFGRSVVIDEPGAIVIREGDVSTKKVG